MNRFHTAPTTPWLHCAWLLLLALVFAQVEIQIEGANRWAANLPTWRIEAHPLLDLLWGGRPLSGYHFWVLSFMFLVFHLPVFLLGLWTLRVEARILGGLMLFWIAEDFLWFLLNPAYGLSRFSRQQIPWHQYWLFHVPVAYLFFSLLGTLLLCWSYRRGALRY